MIKIFAINSKYVHTLLSPYYLKENCSLREHIEIIQTNINQSVSALVDLALSGSPKVIAFPCYIFNIECVLRTAKAIKAACPDVVIIFGGPEASFEYEHLLHYCDYLITGAGEVAFDKLICDLVGSDFAPLEHRVYVGEAVNFSSVNSPYSDDYFRDVEGKIAYFEASRGCPFSCAYCMSGGEKLSLLPLNRVFFELSKFKGKNIRVLKFVDRTFNANKQFSKSILNYILENEKDFDFGFHFEIAADILDDEFIELVSRSRKCLFQFEVGVQSFNEKTLCAVVRKTNLARLEENLSKLIATRKAHIHTDLIAGLPYEGLQSFKDGFNRLYSIGGDMLQLGFLKVLRGSALKNMLDDGYEYGDAPPYEIISTPYLTREDMLQLKYAEEGCDKLYNSSIFARTLAHFAAEDPFDFFVSVGRKLYGKRLSLFDRIDVLFNHLSEKYDKVLVRGLLTIDYMQHNNSKILPKCLMFEYDKGFAKQLKALGIDKKKYFAVKIGVNPENLTYGKYLLYVDYSEGYNLKYIRLRGETK